MTVSEAIREAIDSGTHINAEGCYRLALAIEKQSERQVGKRDGSDVRR